MGILHIHIKNIGDRKNHSSADALAVMQGTVVNNVGWLVCHFTLVREVVIYQYDWHFCFIKRLQ